MPQAVGLHCELLVDICSEADGLVVLCSQLFGETLQAVAFRGRATQVDAYLDFGCFVAPCLSQVLEVRAPLSCLEVPSVHAYLEEGCSAAPYSREHPGLPMAVSHEKEPPLNA